MIVTQQAEPSLDQARAYAGESLDRAPASQEPADEPGAGQGRVIALEDAIAELKRRPWVRVVDCGDSGLKSDTSFDEVFMPLLDAFDAGMISPASFMIRSLGARDYLSGRLRVTLEVFHLDQFVQWIDTLSRYLAQDRSVSCAFRLIPGSNGQAFSVELRYFTQEQLYFIAAAIYSSLERFPI